MGPLEINGPLANRELTSWVKETTGRMGYSAESQITQQLMVAETSGLQSVLRSLDILPVLQQRSSSWTNIGPFW